MESELAPLLKRVSHLLQSDQLAQAATTLAPLKASHANVGDVWALDGEIAIRQGRLQDALLAVDKAAELESHLPDRHIQRARCQVLAGKIDEARQSALRCLGSGITRADHLLVLGSVLVRCGEHDKALQVYLKAAAAVPDHPEAHRGLASVYRFLGRLEEAEAACDRTLQLDPNDYEILGLRSSLRTQTTSRNHVEELLNLQAQGIRSWRGRVHVAYALAKEYEDLGEYGLSFAALQQGATIKREHIRYNHADDLQIFASLKSAYSKEAFRRIRGTGHSSKEPVFVLGMPPTGSTLVERIITSHSAVQGMGELSTFSLEMMALVRQQSGGQSLDRLGLAERTLALPMKALGENYLRAVAPARDGSPRFVDKLPLNCLNTGTIAAALPNAKIVHVVRHPMDACYAMYKYLFKNGYPFSYTLPELAGYYIEYHRLMQHWREILPPGQMHEIKYEQLVENLETEARKLLAFLELPWQESCIRFHQNSQASTTGSAAQVRRPVYSSSVGKWRCFEQQLRPLQQALQSAGIEV